MEVLSTRSPKKKNKSIRTKKIRLSLILILVVFQGFYISSPFANENIQLSESSHDAVLDSILNPFQSTCYDWRGKIIPCDFKGAYAELLLDKSIPNPRFTDNKDGTVTDNLTKLVWLKNANCFGMQDWQGAVLAAKNLKEGDCGPNLDLVLSDGSSAGDWRLPTMIELCTLIDFSERDPALPNGHRFSDVQSGYYWSATTINYSEMARIVYIKSGSTCYENVKNRAGYILPVRSLKE